jgi:hypothetical protein
VLSADDLVVDEIPAPSQSVYDRIVEMINLGMVKGDKGDKGDKGEKGDAGAIKFITVVALPTENIDESAIYLVPIENADGENRFTEYAYIDGKWETLGAISIQVDHSEYVKFTDRDTFVKGGVTENSETLTDYESKAARDWISAVGKTDYPNYSGKAGVVWAMYTNKGLVIDQNTGEIAISGVDAYGIDVRDQDGWRGYRPITSGILGYAVMHTLTDGIDAKYWTDDTTDENGDVVKGTKTKACETLGAVAKPASSPTQRVVTMTANNKTVEGIALAPNGYSGIYGNIPRYNNPLWDGAENEPSQQMGMLATNYPTKKLHCANKGYIDNLPDYLTLTDEQKAKWRAWLGIE